MQKFHVIVDRYNDCTEFGGPALMGQEQFEILARDEHHAELLIENRDFNCEIAIPSFYPID
jgi:hypothetical protein